jgi:hypothetical protein
LTLPKVGLASELLDRQHNISSRVSIRHNNSTRPNTCSARTGISKDPVLSVHCALSSSTAELSQGPTCLIIRTVGVSVSVAVRGAQVAGRPSTDCRLDCNGSGCAADSQCFRLTNCYLIGLSRRDSAEKNQKTTKSDSRVSRHPR